MIYLHDPGGHPAVYMHSGVLWIKAPSLVIPNASMPINMGETWL